MVEQRSKWEEREVKGSVECDSEMSIISTLLYCLLGRLHLHQHHHHHHGEMEDEQREYHGPMSQHDNDPMDGFHPVDQPINYEGDINNHRRTDHRGEEDVDYRDSRSNLRTTGLGPPPPPQAELYEDRPQLRMGDSDWRDGGGPPGMGDSDWRDCGGPPAMGDSDWRDGGGPPGMGDSDWRDGGGPPGMGDSDWRDGGLRGRGRGNVQPLFGGGFPNSRGGGGGGGGGHGRPPFSTDGREFPDQEFGGPDEWDPCHQNMMDRSEGPDQRVGGGMTVRRGGGGPMLRGVGPDLRGGVRGVRRARGGVEHRHDEGTDLRSGGEHEADSWEESRLEPNVRGGEGSVAPSLLDMHVVPVGLKRQWELGNNDNDELNQLNIERARDGLPPLPEQLGGPLTPMMDSDVGVRGRGGRGGFQRGSSRGVRGGTHRGRGRRPGRSR